MEKHTLHYWYQETNIDVNTQMVKVDDICEFIDRNERSGMSSDMILHCLLLQFISRNELSQSNLSQKVDKPLSKLSTGDTIDTDTITERERRVTDNRSKAEGNDTLNKCCPYCEKSYSDSYTCCIHINLNNLGFRK
jgi:hypothetical protein